jgi:hypothetical protein
MLMLALKCLAVLMLVKQSRLVRLLTAYPQTVLQLSFLKPLALGVL